MNGMDPLAQLRDIHLPQPVDAWWPLAPGWWILMALALAAVGYGLFWLVRLYRSRAYRREAVSALDRALKRWAGGDVSAMEYLQEQNRLLKRVAIQSFGRSAVASLHGKAWSAFLDRHWSQGAAFSICHYGELLYAAEAGKATDIEKLHGLARDWLKQHHSSHGKQP